MRVTCPIISSVVISFWLVCLPAAHSTSTAPSTQGATALQNAIVVLTGTTPITDVTLTGSVEWSAGSDQESGNATYKALPGSNNLNMSFAGGTRTEIRSLGTANPSGTWTGLDGVSHIMAYHNLLTDPGWFPLFTLQNIASNSVTYVGLETQNNASVIHLTTALPTTTESTLMQHLTQVDIYVDPATYLPVSYAFLIHPDNNASFDIPCQILYSDYRNIGGAQIPFHVKKLVNNAVTLEVQFQNATLNTGLTAVQIGAQ